MPHQSREFLARDRCIRLVSIVPFEIWDEQQAGRQRSSQESMRKLREPEPLLVAEPQPLPLAAVRGEEHRDSQQLRMPTKVRHWLTH